MKLFTELQKIGKALLTPVAVLPAAGLLLALGNKLGIPLMEQTGGIIFSNLPLLFCVGVARYCRFGVDSSVFGYEYSNGDNSRCYT